MSTLHGALPETKSQRDSEIQATELNAMILQKKTIKHGQKSFNSEIVCKLYQYLFILFKMSIEM